MKKNGLRLMIILLVMGLCTASVADASAPMKIKLAHLGRGDVFTAAAHAGAVNFGFMFNKLTGGRYELEIFPQGTLGREEDLLAAVQADAVQIIIASMVSLHRIFPPAQVGMAPYVFRNELVAYEVFDGPFGQKILDGITQKTGIKALIIQDLGFLAISNNKRPVVEPKDFKGIKFRAMDPLQANMFKALGASATPIPWPEVYSALQTGVVDGQTNAAFVINAFKLHEVQQYLSLANSQMGYQIYLCNKAWYDKLTATDKIALRDAVETAKMTARYMSVLLESQAAEQLRQAGMNISPLTGEQVAELQKLAGPTSLEWLKTQMDAEWVDGLLNAIESAERKLGYRP